MRMLFICDEMPIFLIRLLLKLLLFVILIPSTEKAITFATVYTGPLLLAHLSR